MGIGSAIINRNAARDAANTSAAASDRAAQLQADAAREATAEQRRQFDTTQQNLQPWLTSGRTALSELDQAAAGDFSRFYNAPDYNFQRTEGQRDIGNSFAARGGAASGNALKALAEFNSNLAKGSFGDWWNRTATRAGVGQTTANNLANYGANTASTIGNINTNAASNIGGLMQNAANARASGIIQGQNAINQGASNTSQWVGRIFGWGS